jgi:hypothetical protein
VRATTSGPRGPGHRETSSPSKGDGQSGKTGAQGQMQDFKAASEPSSGGELEPSQAGGGGVGECKLGEADEPTSAMMKGKGSGCIKAKQRDVGGGDDARIGALGAASSCGGRSGSHLLALA